MKWSFADLVINRLIAHEVPMTKPDGGPQLSDEDRPPDQKIENFFRERMTSSLTDSGIDVEFDSNADATVKTSLEELFKSPTNFAEVSKRLARRLYEVQNRLNTAGLLVIATGTIQNHAAVCILKLEHEEGIRVVEQNAQGIHTFNLEYLNTLVLTKRTKVFKVGLFIADEPTTYARVSDEQFGRGAHRGVAEFYLRDFLGCRFASAPDVQTGKFLEGSQTFINEDVADPEKRARYEQAVMADLNSHKDGIRPRQFAQTQIDTPAERHQFLQRIEQAGLPTDLIPKDLALIASTIKRIQMRFANGTTISAHPDLIGDQIRLTGLDDGRTRIEMEDVLKRIHPRG